MSVAFPGTVEEEAARTVVAAAAAGERSRYNRSRISTFIDIDSMVPYTFPSVAGCATSYISFASLYLQACILCPTRCP